MTATIAALAFAGLRLCRRQLQGEEVTSQDTTRACRTCGTSLTGRQASFCSRSCQVSGQNRDRAGRGNTNPATTWTDDEARSMLRLTRATLVHVRDIAMAHRIRGNQLQVAIADSTTNLVIVVTKHGPDLYTIDSNPHGGIIDQAGTQRLQAETMRAAGTLRRFA